MSFIECIVSEIIKLDKKYLYAILYLECSLRLVPENQENPARSVSGAMGS